MFDVYFELCTEDLFEYESGYSSNMVLFISSYLICVADKPLSILL